MGVRCFLAGEEGSGEDTMALSLLAEVDNGEETDFLEEDGEAITFRFRLLMMGDSTEVGFLGRSRGDHSGLVVIFL